MHTTNNINSRVLNFPKKILFRFLVITLIMFTISPWQWPIQNPILFYSLNIAYLLLFSFGYNLAKKTNKVSSKTKQFNLSKILTISLFVNILFIYHKFLFNLKVSSISFTGLMDSIALGLYSPSLAYAAKHESTFMDYQSLSNPIILVYFISLPLQFLAIPLGIFHWKKLIRWQKTTIIIIIITDILSFISIGTNKGIFDYIILIPIIIIASAPSILLAKFFTRRKLIYELLTLTFLILGLLYFTIGNIGRKKDSFELDSSTGKSVDKNSTVLKLIPNALDDGYIALDSYLTQGYYAMDLALNLDHEFTYGVGHNNFFISLAEKYTGKNEIIKRTYQYRIEQKSDHSSTGKWHTAYVWLANDLTFYGVMCFVFFVGFFLSSIWIDIIRFANPYAIVLLPLFFIMVFYFPANNQVLGNQGGSFIFWVFFFLWYRNRNTLFTFSLKKI